MHTLNDREKVFAAYGQAMYCAQRAQQSIMQLLVFFDYFNHGAAKSENREPHQESPESSAEVDSERMITRLVGAMNELRQVDDNTETFLLNALRNKSWLAQTYFNDRAVDLLDGAGRKNMLDELEELITMFTEVEEMLDPLTRELCEKYDLTEEILEGLENEFYRSSEFDIDSLPDLDITDSQALC